MNHIEYLHKHVKARSFKPTAYDKETFTIRTDDRTANELRLVARRYKVSINQFVISAIHAFLVDLEEDEEKSYKKRY